MWEMEGVADLLKIHFSTTNALNLYNMYFVLYTYEMKYNI